MLAHHLRQCGRPADSRCTEVASLGAIHAPSVQRCRARVQWGSSRVDNCLAKRVASMEGGSGGAQPRIDEAAAALAPALARDGQTRERVGAAARPGWMADTCAPPRRPGRDNVNSRSGNPY